MDERWVNRSPETMLETFHWFQGELFGFIIRDLFCLPAESGVIAEGFRLLPRLVRPLMADPSHAVWLLPTPEFRRAAFTSRGSLWTIAARTSDPERALGTLLKRDGMPTAVLDEEIRRLGLPAIKIDTPMTEDDLARHMAERFSLSVRSRRRTFPGPCRQGYLLRLVPVRLRPSCLAKSSKSFVLKVASGRPWARQHAAIQLSLIGRGRPRSWALA